MSKSKFLKSDFYICRKCVEIQWEYDWDYKDYNLYAALKKIRLCEKCARSDKHE